MYLTYEYPTTQYPPKTPIPTPKTRVLGYLVQYPGFLGTLLSASIEELDRSIITRPGVPFPLLISL